MKYNLSTLYGALLTFVMLISATTYAKVEIVYHDTQQCFIGDGLPEHHTGSFPNKGNPNRIQSQSINMCITTTPVKSNTPKQVRGTVAIAINGVQIRPGTAEYYDSSSPRGFSRDPSSGWNLEGMGAKELLGLDAHYAHVDERGLYHYHGMPHVLKQDANNNLIGWTADGFKLYDANNTYTSSYQLKQGDRTTPPFGKYDGTYNQDFEYIKGSGNLDQCNGAYIDGNYAYFATENYPFFPRCLWGEISADFLHKTPNRPQRNKQYNSSFFAPSHRQPPQQAIDVCAYKSDNQSCSFYGKNHYIQGVCKKTRNNIKACVPKHNP